MIAGRYLPRDRAVVLVCAVLIKTYSKVPQTYGKGRKEKRPLLLTGLSASAVQTLPFAFPVALDLPACRAPVTVSSFLLSWQRDFEGHAPFLSEFRRVFLSPRCLCSELYQEGSGRKAGSP